MTRRAPSRIRDHVILHPGSEAVLQRIGRGAVDCLVVAPQGAWTREVFASEDEAVSACAELGIRVNRGWEDPRLARRMNARDHWSHPEGQRRAL